jgi:hypothetical protein
VLTVVHDDDQPNEDSSRSLLDRIGCHGARQMLAAALQADVADYSPGMPVRSTTPAPDW